MVLTEVDLVLDTIPFGVLNAIQRWIIFATRDLRRKHVLADSRLLCFFDALAVELTFADVAEDELRHFGESDSDFDLVE